MHGLRRVVVVANPSALCPRLTACVHPSLVVIGDRDLQFAPSLVKELPRHRRLGIMVAERVNGDPEVEGDSTRSIELLAGYLSRQKRFLGAAGPRRRVRVARAQEED